MNTSFEKLHGEIAGKDEWLTPPEIIHALGDFDLDPCAPIERVWDTAKKHYTIIDNGLLMDWNGRVWCNPPYGKETAFWLAKCAQHGNAIVLTFARTETRMFFNYVWDKADAVLFFQGRFRFYHPNGKKCITNMPGAPSVLIAYGHENAEILKQSGIRGKFLWVNGFV